MTETTKHVWIENTSDQVQAIQNMPAFGPGEKRRVTEFEAWLILRNKNFKKTQKTESKRSWIKKNESMKWIEKNEDSIQADE